MNRISLIFCGLVLIGIIGWFALPQLLTTKKAPEIELPLISGEKFNLAQIPNKYVLVSFWATSCAVCVSEIPEMSRFYNSHAGNKFELVAIAMPYDPPDRILRMAKEKNIPYPIAIDIQGKAMQGFGDVDVTPTHFLLSADGSIISTTRGKFDFSNLEQLIRQG